MQLVKYVRALGWTQEQLVVLATGALALVLCIALIRGIRRAFIRRDQVSELRTEVVRLHSEVESLLDRLEDLESDSNDDSKSEAVSQCLRALETGFPQGESECAKAAMTVLLQHAATHPDRNQGAWRALIAKVDRLVTDVVDGSASDPETTKLIEQRVQEMLTDVMATRVDDPAFVNLAKKLFRAILAKSQVTLLENPTADMVSSVEDALCKSIRGDVESWLEDNPDEVAPSVEKLAKAILEKEATALVATPPHAVVKTVRDKITDEVDYQLDELKEEICNTARAVAQAALAQSTQAS